MSVFRHRVVNQAYAIITASSLSCRSCSAPDRLGEVHDHAGRVGAAVVVVGLLVDVEEARGVAVLVVNDLPRRGVGAGEEVELEPLELGDVTVRVVRAVVVLEHEPAGHVDVVRAGDLLATDDPAQGVVHVDAVGGLADVLVRSRGLALHGDAVGGHDAIRLVLARTLDLDADVDGGLDAHVGGAGELNHHRDREVTLGVEVGAALAEEVDVAVVHQGVVVAHLGADREVVLDLPGLAHHHGDEVGRAVRLGDRELRRVRRVRVREGRFGGAGRVGARAGRSRLVTGDQVGTVVVGRVGVLRLATAREDQDECDAGERLTRVSHSLFAPCSARLGMMLS